MTDTDDPTTSNAAATVVASALVEQNRQQRRRTTLLAVALLVCLAMLCAGLVGVALQFRGFQSDADDRRRLLEAQNRTIAQQAVTISELQTESREEAATVALIAEFVRQFAVLAGPDQPPGARAAARERLGQLADEADAAAAERNRQPGGDPSGAPPTPPATTTTTSTTTTTAPPGPPPTTTTAPEPPLLEPIGDLVCGTVRLLCSRTLARWQLPPRQPPPCRSAPYADSYGRSRSSYSAPSPPCSNRKPGSSGGT